MKTDNSIRILTDIDFQVPQSNKNNQSSTQNKKMLTTQFRRFMALPNPGNQTPLGRNISPNESIKQAIAKQTQQDFTQIFSVYTPSSTSTSKKKKKINMNSRPYRINTDIYEDYSNHQILQTEANVNNSTRVGSSCGRFLMPQSATNQVRTKSVGKESVKSRVKNIVSKIYCANNNQMNMYYDSNLTNINVGKPKRNKSSSGNSVPRGESSAGNFYDSKSKHEFTPSISPQNRPISVFQGRQSKLNYLNESAKRRSVMSIDHENSLFQVSKHSDNNPTINQFFESTKNSNVKNFSVQFRNRQQQYQQNNKPESVNLLTQKQQHQNYLSNHSQYTSTEDDSKPPQPPNMQNAKANSNNNNNSNNLKINYVKQQNSIYSSNLQTKQFVDVIISQQNQQNQGKKRSQTQESEYFNRTNYNFVDNKKVNENNKENSNNIIVQSQNHSSTQSRADKYKDGSSRSQQPSQQMYQRKRIFTEFADNFEPEKQSNSQKSDLRNKNQLQFNFNEKDNSTSASVNKSSQSHSHSQSTNQSSNQCNQTLTDVQSSQQQYHQQQQQQQQKQSHLSQQQQNFHHQRIAQIVSQQQQQEKQQEQQTIHPKVLYDMTDDEWNNFGDRFPPNFTKIKLLGRGGFALVWLGEDIKTKEQYAIKQVSTKNVHQTHIKEIWFGSQFFENGKPKPAFRNNRGLNNMIRLAGYDLKPVDTWLFYELGGESLGTNLYDLKGDGKTPEGERIYKIIYKEMYLQMRGNLNILKQLIYELAHALLIISDQKIVHSDLKTENILIKTKDDHKTKKIVKLESVKLIDYGSAFTFGNLKNFSMATPEYMAPEILNYILYTNNLNHNKQLVEYLKDYNLPHVIDMWSLGCVVLELINGIPLWMSLKTKINFQGKEHIKTGLFAVKNRVFESIIQKQIDTINNLDNILDQENYSHIFVDDQLRNILKRMLQINPLQRITPQQIIDILQPTLKEKHLI